jgi:hypothetical protein
MLDILSSPYVMALPVAALIILLLPDIFDKYEVSLERSERSHKASSIEEYHDLDGDGFGERVVVFPNEIGVPALKVLTHDDLTVDQWNFSGKYPERQGFLYCGDMNGDGISEIYLFTVRADTLYLNAVAPFTDQVVLFKNKFITTVSKCADTFQVLVGHGAFHDLDGDGHTEFLFAVKAGYSRQPRALFAYDLLRDTLWKSENYGANMGHMIIDDTDGDGKAEIFCACHTLGNIPDSLGIPFDDYSSYFMGFDHHLNLRFPPLEYAVYPSGTSIGAIETDEGKAFAVFFKNLSDSRVPSELKIVSPDGHILRERTILTDEPVPGRMERIIAIDESGQRGRFLMTGGQGILELDDKPEIIKEIALAGAGHVVLHHDLDMDGEKELVLTGNNDNFLFVRNTFDDPVAIEHFRDPFSRAHFCISIKENGASHPEVFIKDENNRAYFYTYKSNLLYYLKYPLWLGIYLVILSLILLIRYIQKAQLQRRMEMENRLNALKLKTIKSQMDPHFMFNALNSISINIMNKETDVAYRYLVKYSELLRQLLNRAEELSVSLEEELDFVRQYLELEQFRFRDGLRYLIDIDPAGNKETPIPRMLIQIFVENAIKHGIRNMEEGKGKISISTRLQQDHLMILVEDNGIGRKLATRISSNNQGMGLKIIDEMITLFEKVHGKRVSYEYEDLFDEKGRPVGTRVKVLIPE